MINCFDPPFSMITYKYKPTFTNIRNRESLLFLSIQHGWKYSEYFFSLFVDQLTTWFFTFAHWLLKLVAVVMIIAHPVHYIFLLFRFCTYTKASFLKDGIIKCESDVYHKV